MRQRSDCGIVCGGGQAVLEGHELRSLDEDGVVSHGRPPAHVGRRLPRDMDRVAPMCKAGWSSRPARTNLPVVGGGWPRLEAAPSWPGAGGMCWRGPKPLGSCFPHEVARRFHEQEVSCRRGENSARWRKGQRRRRGW